MAVGFQRLGVVFFPLPEQVEAEGKVDEAGTAEDDKARVKSLWRHGGEKGRDGLNEDDNSGQQNKAAFKADRKRFDFAVSVRVALVRRLTADGDAEEQEGRSNHIDDRLDGIGKYRF